MRKFLGWFLVICLLLSCAAGAFAAGKPSITKQPVTATTDKSGKVTFTVKVKTGGSNVTYSWRFVNPATGEEITAKNITKTFKKMKVAGPNRPSLTLKKVPEEMHGWIVYCHINGNGYKIDSDRVQLLIYGMDPPAPVEEETPPSEEPAEQPAEPAPEQPAEATPEQPAEPAPETPAESAEPAQPEPQYDEEGALINRDDKQITVTCSGPYLYPLNTSPSEEAASGVDTMTFTNVGEFAVKTDVPIKSWAVNGVRFEPMEECTGFKVTGVTEDTSINVRLDNEKAFKTEEVDESVKVKISCQGCTFTYMAGGIKNAASGDIPAGATIIIRADNPDATAGGYIVNGADPAYQDLASFRLTVTEDTTIVMK